MRAQPPARAGTDYDKWSKLAAELSDSQDEEASASLARARRGAAQRPGSSSDGSTSAPPCSRAARSCAQWQDRAEPARALQTLQTARARAQEEDWVDEAETEIQTPGAKLIVELN